jgi:hypothetical protein
VAVSDQLAPKSRTKAAGSKARRAFRAKCAAPGATHLAAPGMDAAGVGSPASVASAAIHEGPPRRVSVLENPRSGGCPMALVASRRRQARAAAAGGPGGLPGQFSVAWPPSAAQGKARRRAASQRADFAGPDGFPSSGAMLGAPIDKLNICDIFRVNRLHWRARHQAWRSVPRWWRSTSCVSKVRISACVRSRRDGRRLCG